MGIILHVKKIDKSYDNCSVKILNNIEFYVETGEFVGIMGASGSGKTTLLNCISTIDTVSAGNIFLDGIDINELKDKEIAAFRRKNLGFIFQDFNLLDTLTVRENISLTLTINKEDPIEIDKKVNEIAALLKISHVMNKYPYQISGGEKQRCASARAIIHKPRLILADEPTGALDSNSSKILLDSLKLMNQDLHATILMVTHDTFSASYTDRILFMKDGKIVNKINKGRLKQRDYYEKINKIMAEIGGDMFDVY